MVSKGVMGRAMTNQMHEVPEWGADIYIVWFWGWDPKIPKGFGIPHY